MPNARHVLPVLILPLALAACQQQQPASTAQAPAPADQQAAQDDPVLRPEASLQEIMKAIVEPSSNAIWNAVSFTSGANGPEEHKPETEEEWTALRYQVMALIEAANLMVMDGRKVVTPGHHIQDEGQPGNLTPDEIQMAMAVQRDTFVGFAHGLQDAAKESLAAIEAKDADRLSNSGGALDTVCETCHTTFWYPAATP